MFGYVVLRYLRAIAVLLQCRIPALISCLIAVCMVPATPAFAQTTLTHISAELRAEGPAAPGQTVLLAIAMHPASGWHGYWQNPGDAGFGMRLDWSLPAGATAGTPRYPVPETLVVSGLMNHVFQSDYAVLVPITLPASARPGAVVPITLKADWLACTVSVCVPESARLATTITIAAPGTAAKPDPAFDTWRAKLPAPLLAPAHFAIAGAKLRLAIPLPATSQLAAPHLFLADDHVADYAAEQSFARAGDTLLVTLQRARVAPLAPASIAAVLRLDGEGDGISLAASPGVVPMGGTPIVGEGTAPSLASLPLLLLAALAGGLLLNVMPCVFPILSLKALSLARAGESQAEARTEGLAYTAGVVLACLLMGGLLLALRAAGQQVGWAFQLQEPGVVAALLLLAVAITGNLLGLFEFAVPSFAQSGTGAKQGTASGAFATGLLAAFVATPCTGPFMAGAMGAALLLPVLPALALFGTLGLGIALPFLAIAFIPALRRALPRPGNWMVWFRRAMALPMGLTALALGWLASRLGGWGFAGASLMLAAVQVLGLYAIGKNQRRGLAVPLKTSLTIAALLLVGFLALPRTISRPDAEAADILPTQPFSETALASARAAGHPVFAYFTADWCLTCKVNERLAIERETTRAAFARAGVVVLKGDWTRRDPAITHYLTAHGAAGVPFYMWYPAKAGAERQLPQVLSPDLLARLP